MRVCERVTTDIIQTEMQKIFQFEPFAVSARLRKFLAYVVNETISGRSENLKEYNIAVDVMDRPARFKTAADSIVRVHARRLRNALEKYYSMEGTDDECIISIPKGRYIPVFDIPGKGKIMTEGHPDSVHEARKAKSPTTAGFPGIYNLSISYQHRPVFLIHYKPLVGTGS